MNIVLYELLYLCINENALGAALGILLVLQIKTCLCQLFVGLLEPVLLQQLQELVLLGLVARGYDLVEEAFVERIGILKQLIDILLESVVLVHAVDEHLDLVNSMDHLFLCAHSDLLSVVLRQLEVLEHVIAQILHADHVLEVKLNLVAHRQRIVRRPWTYYRTKHFLFSL